MIWLNKEFPDDIVVATEVLGPYDLNIGITGDENSDSRYILGSGGERNSKIVLVEAKQIVKKTWAGR